MVNLHFSLLPRWRGAAPVERAILAGDERTGVDLMAVEEGLDTGGIYAGPRSPIGPDETLDELRGRLVEAGTGLLVDALARRARRARAAGGRADLRRQDRARASCEHRLERARPSTSTGWCASAAPGRPTTARGSRCGARTCRRRATGPWSPAGDGPVELVEVQPEGKARMPAPAGPTAPAGSPATGSARDATRAPALVALDALDRIDADGAYANLAPARAARPQRPRAPRDRHFVTELVYGTTRMRRACDFLVDRFLTRDARPDGAQRAAPRRLPAPLPRDAAARRGGGDRRGRRPRPARGLVNAVLRRVADSAGRVARRRHPPQLPRLDRRAARPPTSARTTPLAALEAMNTAPPVTERDDGYVQDLASQWVAEAVERAAGRAGRRPVRGPGRQGHRCSPPPAPRSSPPTSARAGSGSSPPTRAAAPLPVVVADGARPPFAPGSFDRVLVDAPCSGLGRCAAGPTPAGASTPTRPTRLAALQRGARRRRPSRSSAPAACSCTRSAPSPTPRARPSTSTSPPPTPSSRRAGARRRRGSRTGRGARLLPRTADTDGMYLLRLRDRDPA